MIFLSACSPLSNLLKILPCSCWNYELPQESGFLRSRAQNCSFSADTWSRVSQGAIGVFFFFFLRMMCMNLCIWVQVPFDASGMDSLELQLEAFIAARLGHREEPCEAGCSLLCRLAWNIGLLSAGSKGLGHWPSMHSGVSCVQFPFNIFF